MGPYTEPSWGALGVGLATSGPSGGLGSPHKQWYPSLDHDSPLGSITLSKKRQSDILCVYPGGMYQLGRAFIWPHLVI